MSSGEQCVSLQDGTVRYGAVQYGKARYNAAAHACLHPFGFPAHDDRHVSHHDGRLDCRMAVEMAGEEPEQGVS